jgi:hypothetical protein
VLARAAPGEPLKHPNDRREKTKVSIGMQLFDRTISTCVFLLFLLMFTSATQEESERRRSEHLQSVNRV